MRATQSFARLGGGVFMAAVLSAPGAFAAENADMATCSRLTDPATRLACFDNAAAAMQRGAAPQSTAPAPRAAAPAAQTPGANPAPATAFARPAPPPPRVEEPQVKRAAAALRTITTAPDGRMLLTLEDGSVWQQIDDRRIASPPQPGDQAEVRRGLWGAYFIDFQGEREIRARRLR